MDVKSYSRFLFVDLLITKVLLHQKIYQPKYQYRYVTNGNFLLKRKMLLLSDSKIQAGG